MPDRGGQCIGVADEYAIGLLGQMIFKLDLTLRNMNELLAAPLISKNALWSHVHFRVLASIFGNPDSVVVIGKGLGQSSLSRRFGSDDGYSPNEISANAGLEKGEMSHRILANLRSRNRNATTFRINAYMNAAEQPCITLTVLLRSEHHVGRIAKDLARVVSPELAIVVTSRIGDFDHIDGGMYSPQPRSANRAGNGLIRTRANDYVQMIDLLERRVDKELVPAVRRVELADHQAAFQMAASAGVLRSPGSVANHCRTPIMHMARKIA